MHNSQFIMLNPFALVSPDRSEGILPSCSCHKAPHVSSHVGKMPTLLSDAAHTHRSASVPPACSEHKIPPVFAHVGKMPTLLSGTANT